MLRWILESAGLLVLLFVAMIVIPMIPYGFIGALVVAAIVLIIMARRIRRWLP